MLLRTVYFIVDVVVKPLSPKSDQHQISPCNINAYRTLQVDMRIKDTIISSKVNFNNFSTVLL